MPDVAPAGAASANESAANVVTVEPSASGPAASGPAASDRPSGRDTWPKGRPLDAELDEPEAVKPIAARAVAVLAPFRNKRTRMIAIAAGAAVLLIVVLIVAMSGGSSTNNEPAKPVVGSGKTDVDRHLEQAEARIGEGKLVGPGGDTALGHLLEAKRLAPSNQQVQGRMRTLADKLEKLGDDAATSGDLAEAATQYQAALAFDPERASARDKLVQVEQRARGK